MDVVLLIGFVQAILAASWRLATPIIYSSIGEVFTEQSGILNIGLEGIMLIGAFTGFAATSFSGSLLVGLLATVLVGIVCGLVFGFFVIAIKANQIVVGAAFNMLGAGLTAFLYRAWFKGAVQGVPTFPPINIPILSGLPFFGEVLFQHNIMVYATIPVALIASFVLYRTAFGLTIRSVGEHPHAADTVGISVQLIRYWGVIIGGVFTAIGGAYLTLAHTNQFVEGLTTGRGFIALAVVVFGRWTPRGALVASLLFGVFYALQLRLQASGGLVVPYQLLQALPYLATLAVLIGLRHRSAAPKALGVPFEA